MLLFALLVFICFTLPAAVPVCPAGMPLGNVSLLVKRSPEAPALPWKDINRLEEGYTIQYVPVLRPAEKRNGKVTMVLIASAPQSDQEQQFVVLEPKSAKAPAEWKVPFRSSLAVFVYAPGGVSTRKLRGLMTRDQDLVLQLADYAEKTEQTENLVQALTAYDTAGTSENLQAALSGFSSQFGLNNRIDRAAPLDQQTMQLFRSLNPALAAYDPMAPSGAQRVSQTAGLATAVAGMFFGSSVGIAAGGSAMALNLKSLMFPNTEFRSSYVQPASAGAVSMCGKREASHGRTRLAYMWARRLPDRGAPKVRIEGLSNIPRGLRTPVRVSMPDEDWKLVSRVRDWSLKTQDGKTRPVSVQPLPEARGLDIDLTRTDIPAAAYQLSGRWDWDEMTVSGDLFVRDLAAVEKAYPVAESQNRLRQRSGKQVIRLEGADFQFVEKVQLVARGDKYGRPVDVPFSLPMGVRAGPQSSMELQVDTTPLTAGEYSLMLFQQDGKPRAASLKILPDPPVIENLPLVVHEGESESSVTLRGRDLDRITSLEADGLRFELRERGEVLVHAAGAKRDTTVDLRVGVKGYAQPVVLRNGIRIAGPRPRIVKADVVLPSEPQVSMRPRELPAGAFLSTMLHVERAGSSPTAHIGCKDGSGKEIAVPAGEQTENARLQLVQSGRLFLSLNPGAWPARCVLTVAIEGDDGRSDPADLGRVVRVPRVTAFRLTDEAAGDGLYYGVITGQDLELIERTGWNEEDGVLVTDLPAAIASDPLNQSLRVKMRWPSPSPRAPLYLWMRGEKQGRATTVRP